MTRRRARSAALAVVMLILARPVPALSQGDPGGAPGEGSGTAPDVEAGDGAPGDGDAAITWGVRPSSPDGPDGRDTFSYVLEPGDSIEDHVGVSNFTDSELELAVYASDAFTTASGGFDLLPAAEEPTDVGSWVAFAAPTVVVPPRSRLEVPFRLTVPDDATPGDHPGGIVASLRAPGADEEGREVLVDRRVGARIHLRVDGPLQPAVEVRDVDLSYAGTLDPAAAGSATVTFTLVNDGNVRLAVTPVTGVSGPFGLGSCVLAPPVDGAVELLPGDHLTMTTPASSVLPLGRLSADVTVTAEPVDPPGAAAPTVATGSDATWALPWAQLLVVAACAVLAVAGHRLRRRRRVGLEARLAEARAEGRREVLAGPGEGTGTTSRHGESVDAAPGPGDVAPDRLPADDGPGTVELEQE